MWDFDSGLLDSQVLDRSSYHGVGLVEQVLERIWDV